MAHTIEWQNKRKAGGDQNIYVKANRRSKTEPGKRIPESPTCWLPKARNVVQAFLKPSEGEGVITSWIHYVHSLIKQKDNRKKQLYFSSIKTTLRALKGSLRPQHSLHNPLPTSDQGQSISKLLSAPTEGRETGAY